MAADADTPTTTGWRRRRAFSASAWTRASPDIVWPLVAEVGRWVDWSFITRASLLREGDPPPDGVGALRRFAVGPRGSVEEVVAFDPPRHLGYEARRGLPVRLYRADVYLDPERDGTRVTWRCAVIPLVPGTGAALRVGLGRMVAGFARGLCLYADRTAGADPPAG